MRAKASACGAGTVVNAISTWRGSAFAVDIRTEAEVELREGGGVEGEVLDRPMEPDLIEVTVEKVLERFAPDTGAHVATRSEIPAGSGMKSSSAAANAAALATLAALGVGDLDPLDVVRIGVDAARECGVTITGAFDDGSASFLGGLVFTDNRELELLERRTMEAEVLFYVPEEEAPSSEASVERAKLFSDLVDDAFRIGRGGEVDKALTLNGLIHCVALGFDPEPVILAMEGGAKASGLSGTGPSFTAVPGGGGDAVADAWSHLPGEVVRTSTDNEGARVEPIG